MCVCEQTIASSLMATVAARTTVEWMSTWITVTIAFPFFQMDAVSKERCAETFDDCGPGACGNENCVDEVNRYTCDCNEDNPGWMLLVNGSVCVAKECEIFLSNTVQWNRRECEHERVTMPWHL